MDKDHNKPDQKVPIVTVVIKRERTGVLTVTTVPPNSILHRRFWSEKPVSRFKRASDYAISLARSCNAELVDLTHTLSPEECIELVRCF